MNKIYEPLITVGSGLTQAIASILIIKFNLSNLTINEVQVWILSLAILQFYTLIEFGVTSVLPKKISDMKENLSERYQYLSRYTNRAIVFHILSFPFVFVLFLILIQYEIVLNLSCSQLVLLSLVVVFRAYSNINLGIIYSLGENILEKKFRLASSAASVAILFLLTTHNGYSLDDLLYVTLSLSILTLLSTFYYIKLTHAKSIQKVIQKKYFEKISSQELDTVKTSLPAMFVINTLPFMISIFLTARDNVNFAIAQQIFSGLGIFVLAPIVIIYKKITTLSSTKMNEAKSLLLRAVQLTTFISISFQIVLAFALDYFLSLISKDKNLIDHKFIIVFLALMSFEWIQTVMTRGAMAAGHYNFWRQTAASAVLTIVLTLVFIPYFGLYGLIYAVVISQIPTCHYFNIKIALKKYNGTFGEFLKASFLYYCFIPIILLFLFK